MSRPSFSIATSVFNLVKMGFAWRDTFDNWVEFQGHLPGEIVISVNQSEDDTLVRVNEWADKYRRDFPWSETKLNVLSVDLPYEDPAFDGKGKAAATKACKEPFVIFLDADETIPSQMRPAWENLAWELAQYPALDAVLIPSIDLIGDEDHYRCASHGLTCKWYLHKNQPHITRGVVRQAWNEDGKSWRTEVSDSCECLDSRTGELVKSTFLLNPALPHWMGVQQIESGEIPFVYHHGFRNLEQRIRQSEFWAPVWTARRGGKDPEKVPTLEELQAIPRYKHNLPK